MPKQRLINADSILESLLEELTCIGAVGRDILIYGQPHRYTNQLYGFYLAITKIEQRCDRHFRHIPHRLSI